jgi:hypothetical protein
MQVLHCLSHSTNEVGILEPKSKLLGFHMSGLAIYHYIQIKGHSEGQRKKIYFTALDMLWKEVRQALSPSLVIFWVTDMSFNF